LTGREGSSSVDIIFKARHTDVRERFRKHATEKLAKIEKLDNKVIRVDVEIEAERNPRLADRREKVELTVSSRGPAIRAEAAAEDRFAALDIAFAKLEARLRRACDRRKNRHGAHAPIRLVDLPEGNVPLVLASGPELSQPRSGVAADAADAEADGAGHLVPVEMQGDGPLVVREKFHAASPMSIDQALFEMELVGHDFFLFTDAASGMPSVVYRRRGYQYGVIRLLEEHHPVDLDIPAGESSAGRGNGHDAREGLRWPDPAHWGDEALQDDSNSRDASVAGRQAGQSGGSAQGS
jgi:ribosomal subunit interface protein